MYKNLREFYDNIDNPLLRNDFYINLVKSYSDGSTLKRFESSRNNPKINKYFNDSKDNYYVYLFNVWKDNIINTNFFLYNAENEMEKLREYLRSLPDAKDSDDVFNFINPSDFSLKLLMKKYGFKPFEYNNWNDINSDKFFCVLDCSCLPEHILTVNTKYYDTFNFCKFFQMKCIEKNLSFSYSFNLGNDKIDKIVIKTDTEHILEYLNVLSEIKEEHPKLIKRCSQPSIFTGRVNDYIGYGSLKNEDVDSFYSTRDKHTNRCIELITYEFIKNNYKNKIKGNKSSIFLIDYLSSIITFDYLNNLKIKIDTDYPNLSEEDLNSRKMFNHIVKHVKANLIKQLEKKSDFSELSNFKVYYRSNLGRNTFEFTVESLYNTIKENTVELFKIKPNLYSSLKRLLNRSAKTYGISNNYCIDIKTLDDLFNEYNKLLLSNNSKNNK